jgi:hypothetical protein
MKTYHVAALALLGWYLMAPPYSWPYNQGELSAPLSEWKILQRFDTATACESSLQEMKEDPAHVPGEYGVAAKFQSEALNRMGHMGIGFYAVKDTRCILAE